MAKADVEFIDIPGTGTSPMAGALEAIAGFGGGFFKGKADQAAASTKSEQAQQLAMIQSVMPALINQGYTPQQAMSMMPTQVAGTKAGTGNVGGIPNSPAAQRKREKEAVALQKAKLDLYYAQNPQHKQAVNALFDPFSIDTEAQDLVTSSNNKRKALIKAGKLDKNFPVITLADARLSVVKTRQEHSKSLGVPGEIAIAATSVMPKPKDSPGASRSKASTYVPGPQMQIPQLQMPPGIPGLQVPAQPGIQAQAQPQPQPMQQPMQPQPMGQQQGMMQRGFGAGVQGIERGLGAVGNFMANPGKYAAGGMQNIEDFLQNYASPQGQAKSRYGQPQQRR